MVEYLIVLATLAVAAIGGLELFESSLSAKTDAQRAHIVVMAPGDPGAGTASAVVVSIGALDGVAPAGVTTAEPTTDDPGAEARPWWRSALGFGWGVVEGVGLGAWDTLKGLGSLAWSAGEGAWWVVTHPVDAATGVWDAVTHPGETAFAAWGFVRSVGGAIWDGLGNAWETAVNGTAEERGELVGRGIFEVGLTVGTGGAGHATKARWLGRVDDVARVPRRVGQATDDLDALVAAARVAKEEVDDITRSVADATSGEALLAPIKSPSSIAGKLKEASVDGPGDIVDYARSSVVYDSWEDVYRGLDALGERAEIVRVKDRFSRPAPGGYRDILVNVRTSNGHIAEIQLHFRPLLEAKNGPGHPLYERTRDILRRADAEGRRLTVVEQAEVDRLTRMSEDIYGEIWRAAGSGRGAP